MGRPSLHSQHEQLLPTKQLRGVVLKMHDAFPRLCAAWNEENAMRKNWALLFSRLDTDGSGRLDYWEFRRALIDVLEISITEKEAKGLWAYVDHDKSGLVSIKEFQHACYLLILDDWPRLDRRTLTRLCGIINDAAVHEYSKEGDGTSSGNWFKIFGHFDTDESGRLGWEELEQVSRRRDPGLNLSEEKITLNELRGLWRAIDIDCSGDVTVDEFMHFMKKNATQQLHAQWRKEPVAKKEEEESRQDKIKRLAEALNRNRKPRKPRKKPDYLINSKFAKQLQIAQWRKRDTERKIRATLEARSAEAERDFVTRFVQPPSLKEEARRAVILDELSKPLAVDVDHFQEYERASSIIDEVELSEASRHATAIKMLEAKVKRREQSLLYKRRLDHVADWLKKPDHERGPLTQPPPSPTETLDLMKASVNDLREKMSTYSAGRFGRGARTADWTRKDFGVGVAYRSPERRSTKRLSPYA